MWYAVLALYTSVAGFHVSVAPAESLWVETAGTGRTVVLIPGLLGSSFGFRQVSGQLAAAGYRVVVIEPLGTGRSSRPGGADYALTAQADRVAAVLDTIGVSDALVVGHAIGASLALRLSYRRPELVRGVLSIDGGPAETVVSASFRRALRFAPLLKLFGGQKRVRNELAKQLTGASGDPSWVTSGVLDGYSAGTTNLGQTLRVLQAMSRAVEPEALLDRLHDIDSPVMVLMGTAGKSAGLTEQDVALMNERLPALIVERFAGIGHYVHEEKPDAVVGAVVRLDRMTQTSTSRQEAP